MRLIVDTNRIIAALIKDGQARAIMNSGLIEFYTLDYVTEEVNKYRDEILKKSKLDNIDFLLSFVMQNVSIIPEETITPKIEEAINIMKSIDINDSPILACALAIPNDGIWTEDKHFKRQKKVRVWKTEQLLDYI